jgi:hypothetical protein
MLPPDRARASHGQEHATSRLPKVRQTDAVDAGKKGGRKYRCIDCDVPDPLNTPEVKKLPASCTEAPK